MTVSVLIRLMIRVAVAAVTAALAVQSASDAPDLEVYRRIREEGLTRSQVMAIASELVDGIGPRLTGSPNLARAVAWSQGRLRRIGLADVRADVQELEEPMGVVEPTDPTDGADAAPVARA